MATFIPKVIKIEPAREVESLEVAIVIEGAEGPAAVTDLKLQAGDQATLWQGHPSELSWSQED